MNRFFSSRMTINCIAGLAALFAAATYADDPFLQSDGTQYIDTGYSGKPTTRIELDMQLLTANTGGDQYFFGWHGSGISGKLYLGAYTASAGKYCYNCQSNKCNWAAVNQTTSTDRRTVVLDAYNNKFKVLDSSGNQLISANIAAKHSGGETTGGTMPIFASRSESGGVTGRSAFKLFGCRIYEEDVLVHDFRPYRWSGMYGLRDVKTGSFRICTIATGTNELTYGGDIPEGDDPYLQSDGTQFIDTLYYANSNTCVEIDFAPLSDNTGKDQYIFGISGAPSGAVNPLIIGMYISNAGATGWNFQKGSGNWGNFGMATTTERRRFVLDGYNNRKKVWKFNRGMHDAALDTSYTDAVTPMSITVFGTRNAGSTVRPTSLTAMKLYGMKMYEAGVLVRNFVPCRKGGTPGLYDTCNRTFHTDWTATPAGQLVLTGDCLELPDDPYIRGEGATFIDTGYKAKPTTRIEVDYRMEGDTPTNKRSRYPFGPSYASTDTMSFCCFINDSDYPGYCCKKGGQQWATGLGSANLARERFVLDATGSAKRYLSGAYAYGVTFTPNFSLDEALETYHTITLFGNRSSASTAVSAITPMRLYSCKIYEAGNLVHEYVPYVKEGLAGLRDTETGVFLPPRSTTGGGYTRTFSAGGAVESDVEEDAYLLSDGTQAINTGYTPNLTTRIEVDFAIVDHLGYGERIFGTTAGGGLRIGLFGSGTTAGSGNFHFGYGDGAITALNTGFAVDVRRHKATVDFTDGNGKFYFTTTNYTFTSSIASALTGTGAWPMGLFAEPADSAFSTAQNFAKMKLYSAKIYESGVLAHHYLPCGTGAAPSLKDVVTGETLSDCASSATQFSIGGKGFGEDHAIFALAPSNTVLGVKGREATLSAFAPGAVAYQWLADGEPIAGETGETLTVEWSKDGEAVEYSVRATFNRYGIETSSTSDPATVTRRRRGISISFH